MTFPVTLELAGRWCLVVGSGAEARQRIRQFKARGALVRWVYAEGLGESSSEMHAGAAGDSLLERADETLNTAFSAEHLAEVWMAVLADRNSTLAAEMQAACEARRIWFCAVDQPAFNSFSHVAQIAVEPLLIAISSAGRAPLLSRKVREGLQDLFDTDRVRTFFTQIANLRASTAPPERKDVLTRALQGFRISGKVVLPSDDLPSDE
jgi:siroheme synthase-like protein